MSPDLVTVRIDATYDPNLKVGQKVEYGQCLCEEIGAIAEVTCPVSGIVRDIRFEPGDHVFVITVAPASEAWPASNEE